MFLSTRLSPPLPASTHTALTSQSVPTSPAVTAALERFDALIRDALGRSVYGDPLSMMPKRARPWWYWTGDDVVAALTMLVFFFLVFLVLLMVKLALGMVLLHYSRSRYAAMRARENEVARGRMEREEFDAAGVRKGGWGCIEVGPERSAWLGVDPAEGLKKRKKPVPPAEERSTEDGGGLPGGVDGVAGRRDVGGREVTGVMGDTRFEGVSRYEMVAKRIW